MSIKKAADAARILHRRHLVPLSKVEHALMLPGSTECHNCRSGSAAPNPTTSFQTPDTPNIPPSVILPYLDRPTTVTQEHRVPRSFPAAWCEIPVHQGITLPPCRLLHTCHKSVLASRSAGSLLTFTSIRTTPPDRPYNNQPLRAPM